MSRSAVGNRLVLYNVFTFLSLDSVHLFPMMLSILGYDCIRVHEYRDTLQPWLQRPCVLLLRGRDSVPDVLIPLFALAPFSAS